ncbi:uncharacterized protein [Dermacentor albipictus]|uniref:uncharacterized protein isoform X2 n=1 Tax=Dermacentor albipictus TaxID=60249 RepID=UPI0038FCFA53
MPQVVSQRRLSHLLAEDPSASKMPRSRSRIVAQSMAGAPNEATRPSESHRKPLRATTAVSAPQDNEPLLEAEHLISGTAERPQLIGQKAMPLPTVTDMQPAVNYESLNVPPGTQVVPSQGDVACFSSRDPPPPWPPWYTPYTAPALSQSTSSTSTMSPQSSSDSQDRRMEALFSVSDSTRARSRAARRSISAMDSTISYDSFGRTRTMDSSSQEKRTRVEVSVGAGRPSIGSAFASTIRAVIETILPRSQNREMTIETTFRHGHGAVASAEDRSDSTGCHNMPPSLPPPGPPLQPLESFPKTEPIKVAVAKGLTGQPSVESLAPAKQAATTTAPSVFGSAVPGLAVLSPAIHGTTRRGSKATARRGSTATGPVISGTTVSAPAVPGRTVSHTAAARPGAARPAVPGPVVPSTARRASNATGPADAGVARRGSNVTGPVVPSPAVPAPTVPSTARRPSSATGPADAGVARRGSKATGAVVLGPAVPAPTVPDQTVSHTAAPLLGASRPAVRTPSLPAIALHAPSDYAPSGPASSSLTESGPAQFITATAVPSPYAQQKTASEPMHQNVQLIPENVSAEQLTALNRVLLDVPREWLRLLGDKSRGVTAEAMPHVALPRTAQSSRRSSGVPASADVGATTANSASVVATNLLKAQLATSEAQNVAQAHPASGGAPCAAAEGVQLRKSITSPASASEAATAPICPLMVTTTLLHEVASLENQLAGGVPGVGCDVKASGAPLNTRRISGVGPSTFVAKAAATKSSAEKVYPQSGQQALPAVQRRKSSVSMPSNAPAVPGQLQKAAIVGESPKASCKASTPNVGTRSRRPSVSRVGKAAPIGKDQSVRRISTPAVANTARKLSTPTTPAMASTARKLSTRTTPAVVSTVQKLSAATIPGAVPPHATQFPAKKSTSEPAMSSPSVSAPVRPASSDTAITGIKAKVPVPLAVVPDHHRVSSVEILHQLCEQERAALQPLQTQRVGACQGNHHTFVTSALQIKIRPTSSGTMTAGPSTAAHVQAQRLGDCQGNQHTIVTPTLEIRIHPTSSDTLLAGPKTAAPVLPGVVLEVEGSNRAGATIMHKVQEQTGATGSPIETVLPLVVHETVQKTASAGSIHAQPSVMETEVLQVTEEEAAVNSKPDHAPQTEQGIVALPPEEHTAHEMGGVFPVLEEPPPSGAEEKPLGGDSSVAPVGTAGALPGAPMQWRGLSPSAAAPSAAAPSSVAPRFLPRPERMRGPPLLQVRFPIMPPECPPGIWRGSFRGGLEQPTPRQPFPRFRPPPMRGPQSVHPPQPLTQYAEIKWSVVTAWKVPFSTGPWSLLRRKAMINEPLHGGGEGALDKSPLTARNVAKCGEGGHLTRGMNFEDPLTQDRDIKLERSSTDNLEIFRRPLGALRDESQLASAKTALGQQPLVASIVRKAKGKISMTVESHKVTTASKKGKIKTARREQSKITRSDAALKVALKVFTRQDLKTDSLDEERHLEQSKPVAGKLEPNLGHVEASDSPQATKPQPSTNLAYKPPAVMTLTDVRETYTVIISPYGPSCRSLLIAVDEVLRCPASPGALESVADVVKRTNDTNVAVDSNLVSMLEQAATPTAPCRENSTYTFTRKSYELLGPHTMQPPQSGSNTPSTCLEKVGTCGTAGKEEKKAVHEENKSQKRTIQTTVEEKLDCVGGRNQEALVNTESQEQNAEIKRVRVNRQECRESHAAPTFVDGGPSWSLLGCAIGLVGGSLMLLLAVIYSLTTSVPLLPTTQISPETSRAPGIIYCSSQFCDREGDYVKTLVSASGKSACENFYEYVCGAWPLAHPLYSSTGAGAAVSSDTIIQDRLDEELTSLLASSTAKDVGIAAGVYEACVDRDKADEAANDVKALFKTWTIRQWPRDMNGTMKDVWNFAGELFRDLGLSSILDAVLAAASQYSDNAIVELRKPTHIFVCSGASRPPVITLFRAALRDLASEFTQAPKADILEETTNAFIRLGSSSVRPSVVDLGGTKFSEPSAAAVKLSELDADVIHFLTTAFDGVARFEPTTSVILRPPRYLRVYLASLTRELTPRAIFNYMGFLALVHLSAFLPERHVHLRQLFAKSMRGRTVPDISNSSALCAMAVEYVLPACFEKLSSDFFRDAEYGARVPEKLSQLEDAFARNIGHLVWISDEQVLVNRYRIKRRRASQLSPVASTGGNDSCAPSLVSWRTDSPVEFYRAVSRAQQHARWRRVVAGGTAISDAPMRPSSVRPSYDRSLGRVLVPAALFNTSVPGDSTGFSLQLARYAVRFYRALLEALFPDERGGHFHPDEASRRRLEVLLQCFEWDLRELPAALRGPVAPDPATSRGAVLQQTAALQLAFRAFQELWQRYPHTFSVKVFNHLLQRVPSVTQRDSVICKQNILYIFAVERHSSSCPV